MGYHEGHCNADHRKPVGCEACSCEAGMEIKRLRAALDIARSGLLQIERQSEEVRAKLTRAHEKLA